MSVTARQLAGGVGLAALVHAAVAAILFWAPPPPGAQAVGLGGVEVSLGPAGGAPGDVATPVPTPETPTETPPVATAQTPAEVAPAGAPAAPVSEPTPVEPEAAIPVETVEAPPAPAATRPPEQLAVAKPVLPPSPRRKPTPPEPQQAEPQQAEPRPVKTPPAAVPAPPAPVVAEVPSSERVAAAAPSVAGAAGKAGTRDSTEAGGSADARSGGGSPGASADYMSYLLAWLQKHKEYPATAQRRRQEGTALLYFEMGRDGRVRNFRLQRSSGHATLDDAVVALIERAQPLPTPPPEVMGATIELVVPVQFFLR